MISRQEKRSSKKNAWRQNENGMVFSCLWNNCWMCSNSYTAKQKSTMKFPIYIILFIGMFAIHEVTHQVINEYYNCEQEPIRISLKGIYVRTYLNTCVESPRLAHSINDIVGYNIVTFMLLISLYTNYDKIQ